MNSTIRRSHLIKAFSRVAGTLDEMTDEDAFIVITLVLQERFKDRALLDARTLNERISEALKRENEDGP